MTFLNPRVVGLLLCGGLVAAGGACHRQPTAVRQPGTAASPTPNSPTGRKGSDNASDTHGQPPEFAVDAVETREGTAIWYDVPDQSLAARRAWPDEMTAASDVLPQNTYVRVTRLTPDKTAHGAKPSAEEDKPVVVRVTDDGVHQKGVLIEVNRGAARLLGMVEPGEIRVRAEVLSLRNATADKPVDRKDAPVAPKASQMTDKPVAGAQDEKAAAQARSGERTPQP